MFNKYIFPYFRMQKYVYSFMSPNIFFLFSSSKRFR